MLIALALNRAFAIDGEIDTTLTISTLTYCSFYNSFK